jgi:magnesium chelatase family protein
VSGPLADRVDIKLEVPAPRDADLMATGATESSDAIRARVLVAHQRQLARQGVPNALLGTREIDKLCATDKEGDAAFAPRARAAAAFGARLSPRAARGALDRRSRGRGGDQGRAYRRSDPVPAARRQL